VRLLERTTRSLRLTEAGGLYAEHCARIARQAEEADQALADALRAPRGLLRISTPPELAATLAAPTVAECLRRHPELRVELSADDRMVDLVRERYDLAFRMAERLPDASLVVRRVGRTSHVLCATPGYVERHGTPGTPEALPAHRTLAFGRDRRTVRWRLVPARGRERRVALEPQVVSTSDAGLLALCLEGAGIAVLPASLARAELAAGRLVRLLERYDVEPRDVFAVMPSARQLPPKVRAYLDVVDRFIKEHAGL
jgi:DNA-binding transcriptional LysR family regulator